MIKATGDFATVPMILSPNRSSREGAPITSLVWHYTADIGDHEAIDWFLNPKAQASAHFVVGRSGKITQMVPLAEKAWHAGKETKVYNRNAVGVELVNPGYVIKKDGKWVTSGGRAWTPDCEPVEKELSWPGGLSVTHMWVPYTSAQCLAAIAICAMLAGSPYAACLDDQRGHEDIALPPGHKTDPGPLFPWGAVSDAHQRRNHITRAGDAQ